MGRPPPDQLARPPPDHLHTDLGVPTFASLATATMVSLQLDPEYGYVLLVVVATYLISTWMGFKVGGARKKLGVPYPAMYSDKQPLFNCYQRAHQNTLENIPTFLALVLLAGLFSAKWAAGAGMAWVVGRVVYAMGYYTGNPGNRLYGFAITKLVGEIPLFGMVVAMSGNMLGWW